MTDKQQTRFIDNLRRMLGRTPDHRPTLADLIQAAPAASDLKTMRNIQTRKREQRCALVDRMITVGRTIHTHIRAVQKDSEIAAAIAGIAVESEPEWGDDKTIVAWNHPLINGLKLPITLKPTGIPVLFAGTGAAWAPAFRQAAESALIGITSADFAVAETATLAMKTRRYQPLYVSLLPSIHIAVIRLEQILADLRELYTLLKFDPRQAAEGLTGTMSLITGPSKTADIEATLVHGAHGPRELHVFVLMK